MILNDNSTQQINTLVIQLQNRITNLTNEFNKKVSKINDEISDLDTLKKEIADLVKDQINVDSSMNKQITENKNNIAANSSSISELNTQIQTNRDNIATNTSDISALKTSVAGKADKSHTHSKSEITDFPTSLKNPNALTVNGKTYDGSTAIDAGVQTVANGGTGVTTQADINKAFIGNLGEGTSDVTDGTEFVSSYASNNGFSEPGYANTPFRRKFSTVWNYIKDKISSVLGLTANNYGGTAATILDYVKGTPIKVRWSGPNLDSAEWYPAFSDDGSAIEPINRTNIHAGTADKLKSTQIPAGADLNNYHTPGFYHAIDNTNYANAPIANFTLQVIQLLDSYTFQVIYAYGSNLIYTRSFIYTGVSRVWTKWAHTVVQTV